MLPTSATTPYDLRKEPGMSEMKNQPHDGDVETFLVGIEDPTRREDCRAVVRLMEEVTGEPPVLWGPGIVGFGSYHYRYASGREGDWFLTGVAPRKDSLSIYIIPGFDGYGPLMERLGTYRTGKSCLYVKTLDQVDREVLRELVERSVEETRVRYA